VAGFDFFPAALAEGAHALLAGRLRKGAGALALEDELVEFVVETENLEEADAAAVAGAAAAVAADGVFERGDEFGLGGVALENGEIFEQLDLADRLRRGAVGAEAADETLGDDELDGGSDEEGLDAHVDEAGDGAGGVVRVERGEHQVTGEGGADRDLRGVLSRTSPTMMTSGSWRRMERRALAKVRPISVRISVWIHAGDPRTRWGLRR